LKPENRLGEVVKVRAHVFVSGRVQGVFFRSETQYEANRRNVSGWVRNTRDGRVEAIFEGEKENVEALIDFCRRGPPGARVTKVDIHWENYTGEFKDFRIRYGY
jgi:acylphosphatase